AAFPPPLPGRSSMPAGLTRPGVLEGHGGRRFILGRGGRSAPLRASACLSAAAAVLFVPPTIVRDAATLGVATLSRIGRGARSGAAATATTLLATSGLRLSDVLSSSSDLSASCHLVLFVGLQRVSTTRRFDARIFEVTSDLRFYAQSDFSRLRTRTRHVSRHARKDYGQRNPCSSTIQPRGSGKRHPKVRLL